MNGKWYQVVRALRRVLDGLCITEIAIPKIGNE
jgi:hypothetical protein